jgi:hypothetical protein
MTSHATALIELAPSTLYHYRVKSRDANGNLTISDDFTFTTLAVGPGTTYYVSKNGCSDSLPGTVTQPWCTIGHSTEVLRPGDTVIVGAGVYNESIVPPPGAAKAYITYRAVPGAVLDGTNVDGPAFDIFNQAYIIITGFEVTHYLHPRPAGNSVDIRGASHDVELSNLMIHDNWNGIILQDDVHQITISDCFVYNSRYGVGFENTAHDIFISRVTSHSNKETYVGTSSPYGNGDGFSSDFGTTHLFIRDAVAYDNQDAGYDIKASIFECTNCISHDNGKYGFRLQNTGGPYTLISSLAYGNGWYPLQLQAQGPNTDLYNSTFVNAPGDSGFSVEAPATNVSFRNCIFAGYTQQASSEGLAALDEDYDLFFPSGNSPVGFPTGPHTLQADPMFLDPLENDYHLQPSSPAIGAGLALPRITTDLDSNPRPRGAGYDIGAYEFQPAKKQPPNPPRNP